MHFLEFILPLRLKENKWGAGVIRSEEQLVSGVGNGVGEGGSRAALQETKNTKTTAKAGRTEADDRQPLTKLL